MDGFGQNEHSPKILRIWSGENKGARIEIEDLRENVPDRDGSGKIKKNANSKKKPAAGEIF